MDKDQLTMYLENITCVENLEDAVTLSSDQLKAIVTLQFPADCKYFLLVFTFHMKILVVAYTEHL